MTALHGYEFRLSYREYVPKVARYALRELPCLTYILALPKAV